MTLIRQLSMYSKVLLALCAVLGIVIAAEAVVLNIGGVQQAAAGEVVEDAGADTERSAVQRLTIPPIIAYREIVERPLFSDTRRPPKAEVAVAEAAPAASLSSKWKLTGVILAGDGSTAHIAGVRDGKTVRLQVGMPLDGWRLDEISADHAVFSLAGRTATLRLHDEDEAPPVVPIRRP